MQRHSENTIPEEENQQLVQDLHTLYATQRTQIEDAQSLARIRSRLQQRAAMPLSQLDDDKQDGTFTLQPLDAPETSHDETAPPLIRRLKIPGTRDIHRTGRISRSRRVSELVALLLITALAGSLIVLFTVHTSSPAHHGTNLQSDQVQQIHMMDARNGWAITHPAPAASHKTALALMRTTDGGQTWYDVTPPEPYAQSGTGTSTANIEVSTYPITDFLSATTAWIAFTPLAYEAMPLYFTKDGGKTWQESQLPAGNASSGAIQMSFIDEQHGWLLTAPIEATPLDTESVILFQTVDSGKTWLQVSQSSASRTLSDTSRGPLPFAGTKTGFTFINTQTGWMVGSTQYQNFFWFYVTHDGGKTWQHQDMPPLLNALPTSPSGAGPQFQLTPPTFFGKEGVLAFTIPTDGNYPTTQESATGQILELYVTHDDGQTWHDAQSPFATAGGIYHSYHVPQMLDATHGVFTLGNRVFFIQSSSDAFGMLSSSNMLTTKYRNYGNIVQFNFISPTNGWVVLDNAHPVSAEVDDNDPLVLYHTIDGGQTWTQINYSIVGQQAQTPQKLNAGWSAVASYNGSGSKVMFLHGKVMAPGQWGIIASCSGSGYFTVMPLIIDLSTNTVPDANSTIAGMTTESCHESIEMSTATKPSMNANEKTIVARGVLVQADDYASWSITIVRCTRSQGCSDSPYV